MTLSDCLLLISLSSIEFTSHVNSFFTSVTQLNIWHNLESWSKAHISIPVGQSMSVSIYFNVCPYFPVDGHSSMSIVYQSMYVSILPCLWPFIHEYCLPIHVCAHTSLLMAIHPWVLSTHPCMCPYFPVNGHSSMSIVYPSIYVPVLPC